jgi:hypothetical protein
MTTVQGPSLFVKTMNAARWVAVMLGAGSLPLLATVYGYASQGMSATLESAGALSVPANLTLATSGSTFNHFTGTLTVSYRARTTPVGSASVTVSASSEFSPGGGPTIASGALTYTCGSTELGTPCSPAQTVAVSTARPVVTVGGSACTGGGGSCTSSDPATVQLSFTLANSPVYKTGTYTTTMVFTISVV